jgi:hypothetical protein
VLLQGRRIIVGSELGDPARVGMDDETAFVVELLACDSNQQKPSVIQQSKRESTTSKAHAGLQGMNGQN